MRTLYIGMDIHKNFIQAAAMDEAGNIIKEQQFKSDGNRRMNEKRILI